MTPERSDALLARAHAGLMLHPICDDAVVSASRLRARASRDHLALLAADPIVLDRPWEDRPRAPLDPRVLHEPREQPLDPRDVPRLLLHPNVRRLEARPCERDKRPAPEHSAHRRRLLEH